MGTFVLVHGAWHGGWCYRDTARALDAENLGGDRLHQAGVSFERSAEHHRAWVNRRYILADGWDPSPFRYFAKLYAEAPGWQLITMPCGHDAMVDAPKELAAALARLA